jgi:DNA-binding response OmpR family regulator
VIVLDHDLSGVHGDTLCRMPTDDDPAMILMLTAATAFLGDEVDDGVAGATRPPSASRGPRSVPTTTLQTVALPELVLHVRAPGRRKPTPKRSALRAAGIELDQVARTASRDGRQLDPSTKEFGVLEALRKASPIPVSAEITRIR